MRYSFLLLLFGVSFASLAQPAREVRYMTRYAHPQISNYSASFGVGLNAFNGTVSSIGNLDEQNHFLSPMLSLGLGYKASHYIDVLFRASYLRQKSETARGDLPIPGFRSNLLEGVFAIKHSLFPQRDYDEYLRRWNYYGLLGVGVAYFDPVHLSTETSLLADRDASQLALVVPVGLGVDFRLSNFFSMGAEVAYRFTSSDQLDGVDNTTYANSRGSDSYATLGFFVNYRIPRSRFHYREFLRLKDSSK
ncbi:DUF6089 family protein [Cesiribacter andamanensis]|uniref:DUF6089 domain-containing protein n=1 Tax=Cesiribacter andamanensis AMV16 TaxID=1279009 RepID=M7P2Q4_9BACT|nr:DUF6089 family protein [Cesiribacter andamanensis]EMR04829.1 hypothetical protein ADICEAN_00100 [Cesiribacter andamanensis AMV16]